MTEWQVKVNGSVESNLVDVEVTKRENPYPDTGTAIINDANGNSRANYQQGTLVEFQAREFGTTNSYQTELTAIVAESTEREEQGPDMLEVTAHDVDTLIRGNDVKADISGQSLSSALEQVVKDFTPVAWNSSNVTVTNDIQIKRTFRNERIDNVLKLFSRLSAGEIWGVNDSLEFFFRPAEGSTLANTLGNADIFSYQLPERGEASVNEVRVFYDNGRSAVTVDDPDDKSRLQSQLGTADPVTLSQPMMLEGVTDRQQARVQGQEKLSERSPVLVGTISTLAFSWLLDADPGDTIDITIQNAGFSAEVRIVEIVYHWADDRVDITWVETGEEQKGYEDDFQVRIEDTLKRVEMRPALEAQENDNVDDESRVIESLIKAKLKISGDVDGTIFDGVTLTNYGYNEIRDSWIDSRTWNCDQIAVGTGTSDPSRSDDSLGSSSEAVSVSKSSSGTDTAEFSGSLTTSDSVTELALKDSSAGRILLRATLVESVSSPSSANVSIVVNDDPETDGVLTNQGQQTTRDILIDNSPDFSAQFAVGSGTSDPAEGDTSLASQEDIRDIGSAIIKSLDTTAQFNDNIVSGVGEENPFVIEGGAIKLTQTAFVTDAPGGGDTFTSAGTVSGSQYTGGQAIQFTGSESFKFDFELDHKIPAGSVGVAIRLNDTGTAYTLRGKLFGPDGLVDQIDFSSSRSSMDYSSLAISDSLGPGSCTFDLNSEVGGSGQYAIDAVIIFDERYHSLTNFTDTISGSGYLDKPTLYAPESFSFITAETAESVGSATVDATFDDTTGDQFIKIEGKQTDNSSSATASFADTPNISVDIQLSDYGSQTGSSPTAGINGQELSRYRLSAGTTGIEPAGQASVTVRSSIPTDVVNGTDISEAATVDSSGDTQTRAVFAPTTIASGVTVINEQTIRWSPDAREVNQSDLDPDIINSSTGSATGTNVIPRLTGGQQI